MTKHTSKIEFIGYDSGWGSREYGCEDGPAAILIEKMMLKLRHFGLDPMNRGTISAKFLGRREEHTLKEKTLSHVVESCRRLCNHVRHAIEHGRLPVVFGGDHTSAIGTWSGATSALKAHENFGLIWIDAHLDSHTEETSKSGKYGGWWHGQVVTSLLGHNIHELSNVGGATPKISPRHLSLIGVHSFEPEEKEFVEKHNIRVYYLDEVRQRGFAAVFAEALERATAGTAGFGITLDLDVFDLDEAPGVGAPETGGLKSDEVLPIIKSVGRHQSLRALEIVEFNPHKDKEHKTRTLIDKIITALFTPS